MSDSDDENFAIFGEALEPLDEDNLPRKKGITVEDQYALDAQGRRRFHGAFTGGFSAGYFNTVNTRDGWRPHQFKSSRTKKAESVCQRPEDFMDDEDTGEFGIAPTGIRASRDFVSHTDKGKKRERIRTDNNGPIPGIPVLREFLKPVTDTIGVTLLKKMGWKPGQGVGPRLTKGEKKMARKRNTKKKIYGCLPNEEDNLLGTNPESSDEDDTDEKFLFAPDDWEPFRCDPKDNYFGIGYSGLSKLSVLSGQENTIDQPVFQMQEKNKKLSIRGTAFGVGAFEADDDDIYEREDMSRYDFTLGPENKKNKDRWSNTLTSEASHHTCIEGFVPTKNRLERKKFFSAPEIPKDFKPIHVIRKSRFSPLSENNEISNTISLKNQVKTNLNAEDRKKILNVFPANNNGDIQSSQKHETVVTQNESVNKMLEDSNTLGTSSTHNEHDPNEKILIVKKQTSVPILPSWMEKLTTKNFISGGIEASTENYSTSLINREEPEPINLLNETCDPNKGESSNSFQDSSKGFILAAVIPKPLDKPLQTSMNSEKEKLECIKSSSIDGRSDSGADVQNLTSIDSAMAAAKMKMFGKLTRTLDIWRPANIVCKRFNISEPKVGCAQPDSDKTKKYRIFDALNFSSSIDTNDTKFQKSTDTMSNESEEIQSIDSRINSPNIANVHSTSSRSNKQQKLEESYKQIFNKSTESICEAKLAGEQHIDRNIKESSETTVERKNSESNEESLKCSPSVISENTDMNTKYDLFKAIFLSSSESSDSENESRDDMNSETVKTLLIGKSPSQLNTQRNTSPPRGIFAQLNLDQMLNSDNAKCSENKESIDLENPEKLKLVRPLKSSVESIGSDMKVNANTNTSMDIKMEFIGEIQSDIYGPALPTNKPVKSTCSESHSGKPIFKSIIKPKLDDLGLTSMWVEKQKVKKSKKEKKKHKQKKKYKDQKHRHKSKKKKID